ncbi:MAG: acyl-CoA thioesterase [Planctomycetes bacterium]|nr:acyl-CoA thioesterase [Planctomycetota bacterium]
MTKTRVRLGETDLMGILYHPNYIMYFELGRTEFMRALGLPYSELEARGHRLVVTETGCRYRSSARYDDEVLIRTRMAEVRNATVRFEYVMSVADRVIAEGFTELASVDGGGKPTRLPQELRRIFRPQ